MTAPGARASDRRRGGAFVSAGTPAVASDGGANEFRQINRGYNSVFRPNQLSLGLVVPLENYSRSTVPTMERHAERVQAVERLGFAAVWLRDVPFHVPSFGDAGQIYDPFVYLGLLAGCTDHIALGVASIVLPLRHPAHVAKAAASVDALSNGRLILGVASGDRPAEYPALNVPFEDRGARFRASFEYIEEMQRPWPVCDNEFGSVDGAVDLLPKPPGSKLPLLITGSSQQDSKWLARNGDGWMVYPNSVVAQSLVVREWRATLSDAGEPDKPVMQPLYVDLLEDPDGAPEPIHLGLRTGANHLIAYLKSLEEVGVNHVALNLRFNELDVEATLDRLASTVLPSFSNQAN